MVDNYSYSVRNKDLGENRSSLVLARQSLQFPMQVKVMTEPERRDYHRKKLYELSIKSLGEIPQIHEPTDDQKEWVLSRLSHSNTWPVHGNKIGDSRNWK
jgi:hypothetical protein